MLHEVKRSDLQHASASLAVSRRAWRRLVKGSDSEGEACCFCFHLPPSLKTEGFLWRPQEERRELRALPLTALPVSFYEDMRRCCQAVEGVYDEEIEL